MVEEEPPGDVSAVVEEEPPGDVSAVVEEEPLGDVSKPADRDRERAIRRSVLHTPGMPALVAVSLTGFSGYAALLATAPAYVVNGGASEAGAGLVNGVLLAATVATQMIVARLLRAFGTAPVLVAGMVLMGLPALGYALSDALGAVLAWSAVRGAGFGIVTVVGSTAVARLVSPTRRGEAVGVYGLAVAAPMIVLMSAGVAVAESLGYGWVFAVAALPLLGVPWAWLLGRRMDASPPPAAGADEAHVTDSAAVRLVLRPTAVLFAVTMAGGATMTFAPQLGIGGGWAAAALFAMSLTSALARWRVGLLADRRGPERFVAPLLLLTAAGLLLCVAAISRESGSLLLLAALVLGPPYGALQNLTLLIAFARVPPHAIPTASAAWNLGFDAGTATGSVVVGALASALAFGPAFSVMVAVVLAALLLAPRRRRQGAEAAAA